MGKEVFNVIRESDELGIVEIYGAIGTQYWDGVGIKEVQQQLLSVADCRRVVVRISSFGGDVSDALGIYELLRSLGRKVETECIGMNASAATVIAMAGTVRRMSRYGTFLIHKCSSCIMGNENDIEAELEMQRTVNERLVQLYADRTGCEKAKIEELMEADNGNGRWLDLAEAKEYGFITEEIEAPAGIVEIVKGTVNAIINSNNNKEMKKSIIAFAYLAALLAVEELDAKDKKVLLDEEQMKKIDDALLAKEQRAEALQAELEAAKTAAEEARTALEKKKSELESEVAKLKAIVDKSPAQDPPVGGGDTKVVKDEFNEWLNNQEYMKEAKEALGK